ncbi:MAG: clostripain-related cysteine peptidase [Bacteroidales bacterium]|nr:clostripain-related cysteine peptidase [Bacteroidales bacterium]
MRRNIFIKALLLMLIVFGIHHASKAQAGSYCESTAKYVYRAPHIKNVTYGTVNNNSYSSRYKDYTDKFSAFERGATFDLSVTTKYGIGAFVFVWVDWNKNYDFEESEKMIVKYPGTETATIQLTVPDDAVLGNTRMRITCARPMLFTACTPILENGGEVEDYTVYITDRPVSDQLAKPAYYTAVNNNKQIKMYWLAPDETPIMRSPEDFEQGLFPPAGWQIKTSTDINSEPQDITTTNLTTWSLNKSDLYLGSGQFSAVIPYQAENCNWLITPEVAIQDSKELSFDLFFLNGNSLSEMDIMVYSDSQWTSIKNYNSTSESNPMTEKVKLDLSAYAGKSIKIAFVQTYTDGYNMAIDNVNIGDKSADITSKKSDIDFPPLLFEEAKRPITELIINNIAVANNSVNRSTATLEGFKVFVNNTIVNLGSDAREYIIDNAELGTYKCSVAAVYDTGESLRDFIDVETKNPKVKIKVDKDLAGVGEEVTLTAHIKGYYSSLSWDLGSDSDPVTSDKKEVKVKYSKLGNRDISLTLNGDLTIKKEDLVRIVVGSAGIDPIEDVKTVCGFDNVKISWPSITGDYADFAKINIYRNDVIVHTFNNDEATEWTDENLSTGEYNYYLTVVNNSDKESYPSNMSTARVYNIVSPPYNMDFESDYNDWILNDNKYSLKVGTTADFNKETFDFPDHSGKYIGVNTSDLERNNYGYPLVRDTMCFSAFNLEGIGRAFLEFDYFSEIELAYIICRANPTAEWEVLKVLPHNSNWSSVSVTLPDKVLANGYQFAFVYSNQKKGSNGFAIDNIAVTANEGKHLTIRYNGLKLDSGKTVDLGITKPNMPRDYEMIIHNIGNEDVQISDLSLTNDKFVIKGDAINNVTLAANGYLKLEFTYTSDTETTTPDVAELTINSNAEENPYKLTMNAECGSAEWTYMIYLYEDGTGLNGNKDINELEVLGSIEDKVNYVVLYDCNNDSKDGIYYVRKDDEGLNTKIVSERVSTHMNAGLNMNDWKTLKEFILWAKLNYPADHYGCNVWDHGSGIFRKGEKDLRSACGEMKVWELRKALEAFKGVDGQGFDIFGFDVCLLGQVETVYDIKDLTKVVIASERTEPGDGWDYTTQMKMLNDNAGVVDVYDFADNIVVEFDESYDNGSQGTRSTTQAAIRTDKFNSEFIPALNAFAEAALIEMLDIKSQVTTARNKAWFSDGNKYSEHRDLGDYLKHLNTDQLPDVVKEKLVALQTAYSNSIVQFRENGHPRATGLKMWMPYSISSSENSDFYLDADKYLKISETKWDDYLRMYENPLPKKKPSPVIGYSGLNNINITESIKLFDATPANPPVIERKWTITPDTYEFINGTDATSDKVEVKFTATGTYSVTLVAKNSIGEGTNTYENIVNVKDLSVSAPKDLEATLDKATRKVTLNWDGNGNGSGEVVKLDEGFEGDTWPPADWSIKYSKEIDGEHTDHPADYKKWIHVDVNSFGSPNPGYIHSGKHSAGITYKVKDFNWLITPSINVTNNDKLSFWLWYKNGVANDGNVYSTNFRVLIQSDGAWHQELFYTEGDDPNLYESAVVIDLAKYIGKSIKVAFVYEFADGFQLMVDDVKISNAITTNRSLRGDFVSFAVFRDGTEIARSEKTTYVDQLDEGDAVYEYFVKTVYANPETLSEASNSVSVEVQTPDFNAPQNLVANLDKNTNDVSLTWSDLDKNTYETFVSYSVYRDNNKIADNISTTSYTDKLGNVEGNYEYYVVAAYIDPQGVSEASNKVSVRVDKITTSVNETENISVSVYPNPSSGVFTLITEGIDKAKWYLTDVNGVLIKSGVISEDRTAINVNNAGVYVIRVISGNRTQNIKVVVK